MPRSPPALAGSEIGDGDTDDVAGDRPGSWCPSRILSSVTAAIENGTFCNVLTPSS
jgi:hypothetical protein